MIAHLQLLSGLPDIPRLSLKYKRRGLRPYRQPIDKGQIADNLVGEAVGEVVVGWIMAQIRQGQNRDRDRRLLAFKPPPTQSARRKATPASASRPKRFPGGGELFARPRVDVAGSTAG